MEQKLSNRAGLMIVSHEKGSAERLTVAEEVAGRLRQRIVQGMYPPHAFLPAERELAKDFQTSRVSIANALAELERDGLVSRSPGRGTRILPVVDRLARPLIGVIHGELPAMEDVARQDSLRTLRGVQDTLDRLTYAYKMESVPCAHKLPADHFLSRFGAMIFIEGSLGEDFPLSDFEQRKIPVVVAKLEADLDVCATWADHEEPMRQAVRTFVNLGHRQIAFVGREATFGVHGKARNGYLAGLRDSDLPVDENLIAICAKTDGLSGYFAAKGLLGLGPAAPTAIVVTRDSIAEGVCRAIEEAGLVLGHHVSVIGFDDTTWPEGRAFLTTFREACYEMGAAAAEMLVERMVHGWSPSVQKRKFEAPFILRQSAGPNLATRQINQHVRGPLQPARRVVELSGAT